MQATDTERVTLRNPPSPEERCLHQLFTAQVRRTPEAPALVFAAERRSYAALARECHRLAHRLRRLGVGPEVRVGVLSERTPGLVTSLLAILEAGGVYVPVDPAYPAERQAFILEDARAPVVLTTTALSARLRGMDTRVVELDAITTELARESTEPLSNTVGPGHLAYLIYTSGSTGRPKAVAVEHRSAVALVDWAREVFDDDELSGVLAATSVCFDLSVFELFVPLAAGGKVILADNALALARLPAASEVTLVNTVPSAMRELVRLRAIPESVRTVNLAGEPLARSLVDEVYEASAVRRVTNLYGPSEDTTYSTWAEVLCDCASQS